MGNRCGISGTARASSVCGVENSPMTLVRSAGSLDRRRRRLTLDSASADPSLPAVNSLQYFPGEQALDPFEPLTRDQLIRRLLSERLWKHWLIVGVLLFVPLILLALAFAGFFVGARTGPAGRSLMGAASGLELFASGQLCILIASVRAASHIDFNGHYRCWRWLSVWFLGAAFFVLSDSADLTSWGLAELISLWLGPLQAARPALLIVPGAAFLAWILKAVLPDMGRCRPARLLLIAGVLVSAICVVLQIRLGVSAGGMLSAAGMLATGLLLSAMLLQSRSVIHVNPNPPMAVALSASVPLAGMPSATDTETVEEQVVTDLPVLPVLVAETSQSEPRNVNPDTSAAGGGHNKRRKSA
ncbi:MAG TPA: hypothetical protein DCR20_10675 [Planctomycetaceae bacterium]|nr:hypothetical protein [Planctomycetaceae bacterium]